MRAKATSLVIVLAALGTAACVKRVVTSTATVEVDELRREDALRAAVNLPTSFLVVMPPATERDCPPALRDEGMKTRLTLRRSLLIQVQDPSGVAYRPFGDYSVEPSGQYGEQAGEGVRVDCARLRGVGIVAIVVKVP